MKVALTLPLYGCINNDLRSEGIASLDNKLGTMTGSAALKSARHAIGGHSNLISFSKIGF
jgi:hypothetical protein